jgi:hypothetical protein
LQGYWLNFGERGTEQHHGGGKSILYVKMLANGLWTLVFFAADFAFESAIQHIKISDELTR